MRGIIPAISALLLLALALGVYLMMQQPRPQHADSTSRARRAATRPAGAATQSAAGAVDGVWMDHYDGRTGQRTSRIRAERYEPMKDGRVRLLAPEMEYFLNDGQVLCLAARWGIVTMQEGINRARNAPPGTRVNQTPRYGEFRDVVLTIRPAVHESRPTLTLTMPSASLDHESLLISTAAFSDADGTLAADQVPVTVRGDDYEFDGRGLVVQYNQLGRRLEYLKVFHGQRLLIKRPGVNLGGTPPATRPAAAAASSRLTASVRLPEYLPAPLGEPLAALDPALAAAAVEKPAPRGRPARPVAPVPSPATRRTSASPVYRATFQQTVQVFQGGQMIASADQMQIDYLEGPADATSSATQPAAAPHAASRPARSAGMMRGPSATRPARAALSPPRSPRPETQPDASPPPDQPEQPIEVRWTGPLTIVAVPGDPPDGLVEGHAIVRLESTGPRPVEVINRSADGVGTLRCGRLTFWTADHSAYLEQKSFDAITMTDSRGTSIAARSMRYSAANGNAELRGPGQATVPPENPKARNAGPMQLQWADRCLLRLRETGENALVVESAALAGDVVVHHPQIDLRAARIDLEFDAPATPHSSPAPGGAPPALRELQARGDVRCDMADPADPGYRRNLSCEDLRLLTARAPDGSLYARSLVATGKVLAEDAQRKLAAGYMSVAIAPPAARSATRPSTASFQPGDVSSLVAHDAVTITTPDGATARGDSLTIRADGPEKEITLSGRPAVVTRGQDVLEGPIVRLVPEDQPRGIAGQLGVQGAGRLHTAQKTAADQPPRMVKLSWSQTLIADGDLLTCLGDVKLSAVEPDGTVNTANGHQAVIATTRPATRPSSPTAPAARATTRPRDAGASDLSVLSGRVIRSIELEGAAGRPALLQSVLESPSGALLRMFHMETQRVSYAQTDDRDRLLRVPGAGRMLLMDERPPSTQPAARQAAADPLALRGKTGFSWEKQLVYDGKQNTLEMVGDVKIARVEQDGRLDDPLRLDADRVIVEMEEQPPPAGQRAQAPATRGALPDMTARATVKRVTAIGQPIRIWSSRLNMEAMEIQHDPVNHRLRATGTDRRPVRKYDKNGLEEASFDEVIINTETFDIVSAKNMVIKHR